MALSNVAWGLDVGTTALKAIKLRKDGEQVSVEAFDVVEHEKFLTEPDVDKNEIIKHTLGKFLERNGVKKETVFIGVPGSSTFARFVKLPPVETKKIPDIVKFEAIQQIPFPLEQVNWDFQTFVNPESPEVEVGIFAMKKELVSQVMLNFREAKLDVTGVQMSPLAVYNAVGFDGTTGGKGAVVLDIGAEHTDLIFSDSGRVWLRTINIGGNHFTDSLAKSFKVSFHKAENLKRTAATSKYAKQIFQAMRPIFADLAAESQRSKGFYDSSHRDSKIEKIIGMGNTFKQPNLQKYIQQEMKLEVTRLEGFNKAFVDPKLAAGLSEHVLTMAAAYGLALQGLGLADINTNLLPIEIAKTNLWRAKRPWFGGAAAAIVVGMGIMNYVSWSNHRVYGAESDVAAVDPNRKIMMDEDDNARREIIETGKAFDAVATKGDFDQKQTEVESYQRLATDRKILPMIYQDIFRSLPQIQDPKGAEAPRRSDQRLMIVTMVKSDYLSPDDWKAWPPKTAVAAAGAPVMPPPGTPAPAAAPGAAPGAAATQPAGGIGNHGFGITITGYTPLQSTRLAVYPPTKLLGKYTDDLLKTNEAQNKPYDFVFPAQGHYEFAAIKIAGPAAFGGGGGPAAGTSGTFNPPWGVSGGPFWDAFVPEMLGIKRVDSVPAPGGPFQPGAPGPNELGKIPGVDPDMPGDPKPGTLDGYTSFVIQVKVNIK